MEFNEDYVRNFRAATSSESLRRLACAFCAENVDVSYRRVRRLERINSEHMQDRTKRTPPPQFRVPPLAGRGARKVTLLRLIGTFRLKADPADRPDSVPYLMHLAFLYPSPPWFHECRPRVIAAPLLRLI